MKFYLSLLVSIFIGGVISGNILGDMKQKTGEIVFFMWKGIQVFRKKVIPRNPQSVLQTAHRLVFTQVMTEARDLLLSVIKPYWSHWAIKKSEYNAFMSTNILLCEAGFTFAKLLLTKGNIPTTAITSATYDNSDGKVIFVWPVTLFGGQLATDIPHMAVYDPSSSAWYTNVAETALRSAGTLNVILPSGKTEEQAGAMTAYLWFTDKVKTNPAYKVSNSVNDTCAYQA